MDDTIPTFTLEDLWYTTAACAPHHWLIVDISLRWFLLPTLRHRVMINLAEQRALVADLNRMHQKPRRVQRHIEPALVSGLKDHSLYALLGMAGGCVPDPNLRDDAMELEEALRESIRRSEAARQGGGHARDIR